MNSTIEFSFLLNSCLDIFDIRQKQTSVDQDLGLLHAIDERLAAYGWLTTTGVKFLVIVDLVGQQIPIENGKSKGSAMAGLRDSDLKPVSLLVIQRLRTPWLMARSRFFEHCKARTFSSCRIHSILPMITFLSPKMLYQRRRPSISRTKNSSESLSESVNPGFRAWLQFE